MANRPLWMTMLDESARRAEMERIGQPGRPGYTAPSGGLIPVPAPALPDPSDARLAPDQLAAILRAIYRQGDVYQLPFLVGVDAILLRPAETRRYMFIQNQHATQTLALGLNGAPGPLTGTPVNGLVIPANFGFYEPLVVPQGEIWVIGSAAGTSGILLYSA